MTLYYVKQDDTIWGCGDPACCGEYYEEIEENFVECECQQVNKPMIEDMAEHLHSCNGGGPVLEWREATKLEIIAWYAGREIGLEEGFEMGVKYQEKQVILGE